MDREEVWTRVYCASINKRNSSSTATAQADRCLEEFDKKFPAQQIEEIIKGFEQDE